MIVSTFWLLWIKLLCTWSSHGHVFLILLGKNLRVELISHISLHLTLQEISKCFYNLWKIVFPLLSALYKNYFINIIYNRCISIHRDNFIIKFVYNHTELLASSKFIKPKVNNQFSSVQLSCSVLSDSLQPHELQHTRPPCPSLTLRAYANLCPSSQWCHHLGKRNTASVQPSVSACDHGLFPYLRRGLRVALLPATPTI